MTSDERDNEQSVLARTIWGEARNQGRIGMEAVAAVIMNRATHPRWWGHDVESVCMKRYQFSCWNEGDPNRTKLLAGTIADHEFNTALSVAGDALDGLLHDPTFGADSYYAAASDRPHWAIGRSPCAVIGGHLFYRLELPAPARSVPNG